MKIIQRILVSLLVFTTPALAQTNPDWHRQFPAFKIAGNLYYVGTADLAVYLIHTRLGNILINSDFEQDVPMIRASIEKLGFRYKDTKIVLISHAHGDHDAATGVISITDDGVGMTEGQFSKGFLTIAGRSKRGEKSTVFGRSLTGEKGLGRLAARKLAHRMVIDTRARVVYHHRKRIAKYVTTARMVTWNSAVT